MMPKLRSVEHGLGHLRLHGLWAGGDLVPCGEASAAAPAHDRVAAAEASLHAALHILHTDSTHISYIYFYIYIFLSKFDNIYISYTFLELLEKVSNSHFTSLYLLIARSIMKLVDSHTGAVKLSLVFLSGLEDPGSGNERRSSECRGTSTKEWIYALVRRISLSVRHEKLHDMTRLLWHQRS